jgi:hypothetical protein
LHFGKYVGSWLLAVLVYASFFSVHAQTMDITHPIFPPSVIAGSLEPTPVNVAIPYTGAKPGFWLMVGIADFKLNNTIVPGSVIGSPSPCLNQPVAQAFCQVQLESESGIENVQFKIGGIFANTQHPPGVWDLEMTAEMLDLNFTVLLRSGIPFSIYFAPVWLAVEVPDNATFWVDGNASTAGTVPVALGHHSIVLPMFVTINDTERMRFDSWADGFPQPNRTLFVSSNVKLSVVYDTQYRLTINTNAAGANIAGAGWYDNGSLASFSVTGSQLSTGGVLDLLGAKVTFEGWYENGRLITANSSGSIEMNSPHTILAEWTTDYSMPITFFALVVALGLGVCFMISRAGRKTKKTSPRRRTRVKDSRSKRSSRKS